MTIYNPNPNPDLSGFLKLDQTTPQTVINGTPVFGRGLDVASGYYYKYNGTNFAYADTALYNYYFANSGNLISTGAYNVAIGDNNLKMNTEGTQNVSIAPLSMESNTSGKYNIAIGVNALNKNTTGTRNVALGTTSLYKNIGAHNNMGIGASALYYTETGGDNAAVGYQALFHNETGTYNIGIGSTAGKYVAGGTTPNDKGNYNVFIGGGSGPSGGSDSNEIVIGYGGAGKGSNTVKIGNTSTTGMYLNNDNYNLYFGAGDDMSIYYDGTSGNIDTDLVAPSDLNVDCGGSGATAKTLVLEVPVYKDINMAGYLLHSPASSAPGTDTFRTSTPTDTGIETYAFAVDEKVHGGFELQHDYKEGTDLTFHVHFQIIDAPTGTDNVQWRLTYVILRGGVTLTSVTTIDSPDTAVDTRYKSYRTDFGAITGTSFKIGDQFMFTLTRVAADGDAFAGECLIETAGIHYQIDTLGSRQISTK